MIRRNVLLLGLAVGVVLLIAPASVRAADSPLRLGIVGCDTSHATVFTKLLNDPKATGELAGVRVVAALPASSPDIAASRGRVDQFTQELRNSGVKIVGSMDELLAQVDGVLLLAVDGRKHLELAKPILASGKPVFIDKPLAHNVADAAEIVRLAAAHNTPIFSCSSLRYSPKVQTLGKDLSLGKLLGVDVYGPSPTEPHHGTMFWYGVHGAEILFTLMGPGCERVTFIPSKDSDVAVGVWHDGRVATVRGVRPYAAFGGVAIGSRAQKSFATASDYKPLMLELCRFFRTKKPPITPQQTLEIIAFMQAADMSAQQGGKSVALAPIVAAAQQPAGTVGQPAAEKTKP